MGEMHWVESRENQGVLRKGGVEWTTADKKKALERE